MKLFKIVNWEVVVEDEIWLLLPFKKLKDRDKTKDKIVATNEVAFIWFYADTSSDFQIIAEDKRTEEIKKTLNLPEDWEKDQLIDEAIEFYNSFKTIQEILYESSLKSAVDVSNYLKNTDDLLKERDHSGKPVIDIAKITTANDKIPKLMDNLEAAYKKLIAQKTDNDGRRKGSRDFNTFETGLL